MSDKNLQSLNTFTTGKYVFTGNLQERLLAENPVPVIWADGLRMHLSDGKQVGDSGRFPVSDLILKSSVFLEDDGRKLEAHKLYTWPANLGITKHWTAAKTSFLQEFILNFPIEIISVHPEQGLTWKFITPEQFKKFPENFEAKSAFKDFFAHPETYFFLRRPLQDPK